MFSKLRLLLFALLLSVQTALAANYGAIAHSATDGGSGYSYDHRSRTAAEDAALERCNRDSVDCYVVMWFRDACGALAVGANGLGHAWARGRRAVLRYCSQHGEGCAIRTSVCTTR